jgi:hypothetical protein
MLEVKIKVQGNRAELSLYNLSADKELSKTLWEDKRDLSAQLFAKMDALLHKEKTTLKQVGKISFDCDSPYFARKEKWQELHLENFDGTGKCGFTAWQTGEVIARVINFALAK